jgi:hypothetical protein
VRGSAQEKLVGRNEPIAVCICNVENFAERAGVCAVPHVLRHCAHKLVEAQHRVAVQVGLLEAHCQSMQEERVLTLPHDEGIGFCLEVRW